MRLLLACGLLLAGFAYADERFDKLDFDKDGKVSKAEAAGNPDLIIGFDRADRNKDGKLSPKEYDALLERAAKLAAAKEAAAAKSAAAKQAAAEKSAAAGSTSPKKKN
jgi:hypothetical protein